MKTPPTYGATERFSRHYGYDAAGRRSYMAYGNPATNPGGQAYHYDARGQLTHASFLATGNPATAVATTNPTHQFSFDASGNRQSAVTPALGTVNYTSNNTNAYTMVTDDQPAYDANGNTTHLRGRTLAWDRKNRMRSNGNIEYVYDALGRMVQRKDTATGETHRYSWSGWLMLGERKKDSSGAEMEYLRYTWGADLTGTLEGAGTVGGLLMVERFAGGSGTAQVAHVHPDANGNTMGLTSDTGTVLAWYRYHPFGTLESSGGNAGWLSWNRFTFSTKWHDPTTGLHYYGYRWYDPVAGRWPSRDPIEEEGGLNLYGFAWNSSTNAIDALGLDIDGTGGGVVGCKNWVANKTVGPYKGEVFGKIDFTLGISFWGEGSSCCIECGDGSIGYKYSGTLSVNAGLEVGVSTLRIYERFSAFKGHILGSIDGWAGIRIFGGFKGTATATLTYNTCNGSYSLGADIYVAGYAGLEIGGEVTADGFLDAGWFGEYQFNVGFRAKGVGKLTARWRPKLKCNKTSCSLRGRYTAQATGFVDIGGSVKGYSVSKRIKLADTGELGGPDNLGFDFPNPVGVPSIKN